MVPAKGQSGVSAPVPWAGALDCTSPPNPKATPSQIFPSSVDGATSHLDTQDKNEDSAPVLLLSSSPTSMPAASPGSSTSEAAPMFPSLHLLSHLSGQPRSCYNLSRGPHSPPLPSLTSHLPSCCWVIAHSPYSSHSELWEIIIFKTPHSLLA